MIGWVLTKDLSWASNILPRIHTLTTEVEKLPLPWSAELVDGTVFQRKVGWKDREFDDILWPPESSRLWTQVNYKVSLGELMYSLIYLIGWVFLIWGQKCPTWYRGLPFSSPQLIIITAPMNILIRIFSKVYPFLLLKQIFRTWLFPLAGIWPWGPRPALGSCICVSWTQWLRLTEFLCNYIELKVFPIVARLLLFCNFYLLSQQLLLATPILLFSCCFDLEIWSLNSFKLCVR